MEFLSVTYRFERRYNLGNYEHHTGAAEITARLNRNDCPEEALASVRALAENAVAVAAAQELPRPQLFIEPTPAQVEQAADKFLAGPPVAEANGETDPFVAPAEATASAPKKRGRPKKEKAVEWVSDGVTDNAPEVKAEYPFGPAGDAAPETTANAAAASGSEETDPFADVLSAPDATPSDTPAAAAPEEVSDKDLMRAASEYVIRHGGGRFRDLMAHTGCRSVLHIPKGERAALYAELTK